MPKPALPDQARSGRQQPRRRSRRGQEERWQSRNLSVCNFCCRESASNRCAPGWHCYKAMLVMNTTWLWPMDRRRCSDGAVAGARHAGAGLVQQQRVRVADERDGQAQLAPAAAAVRLRRPGRHLLRAATLPKSYPALAAAALPARARAVHAHPRLACAPGSTWSGCMGAGHSRSAGGSQRQRNVGGTGEGPEAHLRQRHPPQHIRHLLRHSRLRHALQPQARHCCCRPRPYLHLPASARFVIPTDGFAFMHALS